HSSVLVEYSPWWAFSEQIGLESSRYLALLPSDCHTRFEGCPAPKKGFNRTPWPEHWFFFFLRRLRSLPFRFGYVSPVRALSRRHSAAYWDSRYRVCSRFSHVERF